MSIPYEASGRVRQKTRTRESLIAAARRLIAEGKAPQVGDAAARAGISRTAAYRYFPNQRALLVASHPDIARASLLGPNPPSDLWARVETVLNEFTRLTVETEAQLRTSLRLSLEREDVHREQLVLRRGRAIRWIQEALEPLQERMPKAEVRRLAIAIRSAVGIEALVWLTDVAGLSRAKAVDLMIWNGTALVSAALRGSTPGKGRRHSASPARRISSAHRARHDTQLRVR